MEKKRELKNQILLLLLSFIIPFAVMTLGAIVVSIAPFGDNGFLVSDIDAQFVAFFTYWKNAVFSSADAFKYSLAKTLGGDMTGFSAYYLHNPYLFILMLFPTEKISVGIYWMITLMISSMGLTFEVMLDRKYGMDYRHLMFSSAYALSGYTMAYLTLPIYMFSLILFPIVILGIDLISENIIKGQKVFSGVSVYIVSLFLVIWGNYYIGYMVCIFSGLYFLFVVCIGGFKDKKRLFKQILVFTTSTMAVILLLLPFLFQISKSLSGQKISRLSSVLDFKISYRPGALVFNMLPGQFICDFSNIAAPYVYVGIMSLLCVLLFFFSKKITLLKKITYGIMFIIIFGSSFISGLDCIWHGFNNPVGFSHRQSFIIVAFMLITGAEGLSTVDEYCERTANAGWKKNLGIISVCIVFFQLADLGTNAILSINAYKIYEMRPEKEYEEFYIKNKEIINRISQYNQDDNIYRIEKDYQRNRNDAMLLSYNGLSHNSSCESEKVKVFMGRMGFRNQGIWSAYQGGSTSFADSLMGVKYYISESNKISKPYDYLFEYLSSYVYKNPYALNIAWSDTIKHTSSVKLDNPNLFEIQNQIAGYEIYEPLEYSENCEGMTKDIIDLSKTDMVFETTDNILGVKNTGSGTLSSYSDELYKYKTTDSNDNASINYKVKASQDGSIYCYFSAPVRQGGLLYINGKLWGDYFTDSGWGIVNCGSFKAGDEVVITLKPTEDELHLYCPYFYEENTDSLAKWYNSVNSKDVTVTKKSSNCYIISNNSNKKDKNFYVFSIPYDNQRITIDGQNASPVMVYDCLLGVEVKDGWKEICIKF